MEPLSATARVILGMVRAGRRTGYDIKAVVDRSTRFFWAASYGQIYPELKRLERAGLLRAQAAATGGRRRTEYELTPEGAAALDDWLSSPEPLVYELRDEGLLKLFFADFMEPSRRLDHVRAMRRRHEAIVARLREIEPGAVALGEREGLRHPLLVLRGGLELHESTIDWCRRLEAEIAADGHEPGEGGTT